MKKESKEHYGDLAKFYDWHTEGDVEDIPFYVGLAKESGGSMLELGCGTGRVTLPIAESGNEIAGLDLSPDMLNITEQKLPEMAREIQEKVQFAEAKNLPLTTHQGGRVLMFDL